MTGTDLVQDKNTINRTTWLSGAFVKSFLGGMIVAINSIVVRDIIRFFRIDEDSLIGIIIYLSAFFLSNILVAQIVSRLLRPFGFRGFGKQSGVNMTPIKFFAGTVLGIFVTLFLGALIFVLVNK